MGGWGVKGEDLTENIPPQVLATPSPPRPADLPAVPLQQGSGREPELLSHLHGGVSAPHGSALGRWKTTQGVAVLSAGQGKGAGVTPAALFLSPSAQTSPFPSAVPEVKGKESRAAWTQVRKADRDAC